MGKVYLVGAGPGDAELISVKGKRLVESCDVLIYDRLISEEIISWARKDCEKIYVGKSAGAHSFTQDNINKILVEKAADSNIVVRLKGGDPFVFGRGGEEAAILIENNIDFEVVPGITSAIAVPEAAGIPVTHRGASQDIHIVTGHTAESEITDYAALAKTRGTIVFLMAANTIGSIASRLIEKGMSGKTPVAVIENGTTKSESITRTTLENIGSVQIVPPAVIVVGKTAEYDMKSDNRIKSVAITGTEDFRKRLKARLINKGYTVKEVCCLKVIPADLNIKFDEFDWLVFTGRNGVKIFIDYIKRTKTDLRSLKNKIAVIGEGTYNALAEHGIYADYMPDKYTSEALGKGLAKIAPNASKLVLRAEKGSDELYRHINNCKEAILYRVEAESITECREDYIVFGSSLGVNTYLEQYKIDENTKIIAIGEVTCNTLISRGYNNVCCCEKSTVESIVEEIEKNEKIQTTEDK